MRIPQVLVVIPVFNARAYVSTAIESILSQTFTNFQIFIINDGSTDGSEKIVESFSNRGVILWHQENSGPGAVMNRALKYAKDNGIEFIARADADDISLPDRLEKQLILMHKNPLSAACSANCYYIDQDAEKILGTSTVSKSRKLIHWEITNGLRGLIQGVTFFRTNALMNIGGFREKFKGAEETDVFLRLSEKFEFCNSDAYLAKIRFHTDSFSIRNFHKNSLFHFYALDCAKKRRKNSSEIDFNQYYQELSLATRLNIWREENILRLWREFLISHNSKYLILASLLDPRRVFVRILRKLI